MASYVTPEMRCKMESIPIELKNAILEKNVHIESLQDLIQCLESIVKES